MTETEYLRTSFPDVDREFVDGEVFERSMPNTYHAEVVDNLGRFCWRHTSSLYVRPEVRIRVRPGKYRVPDVSVFWPNKPKEAIPEFPPLIALEVLSPDDRMSDLLRKLSDYHDLGVPHVWLINPEARLMYRFDGSLRETAAYDIPECGLTATATDLIG
ncbi:MAG: Uma2 family endonuclease [Acidobacteria bacterium]|nr:Uma2 family endonuclease [Acidobacteriota bacterium]